LAALQLFGTSLAINVLNRFEFLISNALTSELLPHHRPRISLLMSPVHRLGSDFLLILVVDHLVSRALLEAPLVQVACHPLRH
jgi:hypothetical protein